MNSMRHLASLLAGTIAVSGLLTRSANAIPLFSVNTATNDLVRIESTTGVVTTVGALGYDALDIDLTLTDDGRLWGLNSGSGLADIWEINKVTGTVISAAQAMVGTSPVIFAEGLASRGNQLKLGYDLTNVGYSRTLGSLASNGAVTGGIVTSVDMDGLADGHENAFGLYALDREPGSATTLYGMDPGTGAATTIFAYSHTLGLHDLVTVAGGEGIAIETFNGVLYDLNLTNGAVLGTTNIGPISSGVYNGLALADPLSSSVPEAGSLLMFGLGLGSVAFFRRRSGRGPLQRPDHRPGRPQIAAMA